MNTPVIFATNVIECKMEILQKCFFHKKEQKSAHTTLWIIFILKLFLFYKTNITSSLLFFAWDCYFLSFFEMQSSELPDLMDLYELLLWNLIFWDFGSCAGICGLFKVIWVLLYCFLKRNSENLSVLILCEYLDKLFFLSFQAK